MVQEVEPAYSQFTRSWCFPRHKEIIHGPRFAPSDRLRWKKSGVVEVLGFCMWKRIGVVEDSGLRTWSEIDVAGAHQPISTKPRLPRVFTMQKGFIMA